MRLNYNFAFKNSKLKKWERPSPPNILFSDVSLEKKLKFIQNQFLNNTELIYPPSVILILSLSLQLFNIYPLSIVKKLENKHNEYSSIVMKLSDLKSSKMKFKNDIKTIDEYFSKPTLSYLFAFYLQNSVPDGVKLNSYTFSDNGFDINASSYAIDSLNQFLTLVVESPIIKKNSVTLNKLSRKTQNQSADNSLKINYDLEIYGEILKLDIKKRENLYKESQANGLQKKLERFNNLKFLLGI
ncbi:PilN domain-containing protein [Prochlorococcus sp. AH-716-F10]|nr:PilN domain-containing protein [Prochlorococcus sp. AH-716-F10]